MDILGLTGTQAALAITIIGIAAINILGWLKGTNPFNPRQVAASAIIGFIGTLQLVIVQIDALGNIELTDLQQMAFTIGMIAQIMGIDYGAKAGLTAAVGKKNPDKAILAELKARVIPKSGEDGRKSTGSMLDGILVFLNNELEQSKKELEAAKAKGEGIGGIRTIEREIASTQRQIDVWKRYSSDVRSRWTWWR